MSGYLDYVGKTDAELALVDPLVLNLLVARSIPAQAGLDIPDYVRRRDEMAEEAKGRLGEARRVFWRAPAYWKHDESFTRLAMLCTYLEEKGLAYKEDQREARSVAYTDPSDLFLNGVMDTNRGTCGNMATLYVALAWRLGWPVSLAMVHNHQIARYDDGRATYNVEATQFGAGYASPFRSDPDDFIIREHRLPPKAIRSGSDLRALTPRERLGIFVYMRGRHMRDVGNLAEAERDCLLARHLFPNSRAIYFVGTWLAVQRSTQMFEDDEEGTPRNLAEFINHHYPRRTVRDAELVSQVTFARCTLKA